jgi:Ner family transcriptional regulator
MDNLTSKQLKNVATDWAPAQVKCALELRGITLDALARGNGYSHIKEVLRRPWLAAEAIVAKALGLKPEAIWPTRYTKNRTRGALQTRTTQGKKIVQPVLALHQKPGMPPHTSTRRIARNTRKDTP